MTVHPTRTDGVWRVMRFERADGAYCELASNQVGPEAIDLPPGYQLASVTPMVPASEVERLRDGLAGLLIYARGNPHVLGKIHALLDGEDSP